MSTLAKSKNFQVTNSIHSEASESLIQSISQWCEDQEIYRYPILAAIVIIQGSIIIPFTLMLSFYFLPGLTDFSFLSITISTVLVMVTNMALSPMKIIIPLFILNLLINGGLILIYTIEMLKNFF